MDTKRSENFRKHDIWFEIFQHIYLHCDIANDFIDARYNSTLGEERSLCTTASICHGAIPADVKYDVSGSGYWREAAHKHSNQLQQSNFVHSNEINKRLENL